MKHPNDVLTARDAVLVETREGYEIKFSASHDWFTLIRPNGLEANGCAFTLAAAQDWVDREVADKRAQKPYTTSTATEGRGFGRRTIRTYSCSCGKITRLIVHRHMGPGAIGCACGNHLGL